MSRRERRVILRLPEAATADDLRRAALAAEVVFDELEPGDRRICGTMRHPDRWSVYRTEAGTVVSFDSAIEYGRDR